MGRPKGDTLKWFLGMGCKHIQRKDQWMNVLELLRAGYSTADISVSRAIPEHRVYNEIHWLREDERMKAPGR